MPKPVTGLPVVGDAVDDLLRPAVLDADDDDRGDVRVAAGADQRAEVQVEVGAELQPAVGMRDRQRALDVVRDRLGGGVGQVVDRQDDDVVAHADAAVLAPVAAEGGVALTLLAPSVRPLPALGLDVVDVRVLARLRSARPPCRCRTPYLNRVAGLDVLQRDLVADRDVLLRLELERLVGLVDDAQHVGAGLHALDHDDADGVFRAVASMCGIWLTWG